MKKTYTDAELSQILGANRIDSAVIDRKMQEAYEKIRSKGHKHKIVKKAVGGFGAVAAAFVLAMIFCVANPSLAAEIPVIGSIFQKYREYFRSVRYRRRILPIYRKSDKARRTMLL